MRGVGYCTNSECDQVNRGVFLLDGGSVYYCTACRLRGHVEPELRWDQAPKDVSGAFYREVKVYFNFDPAIRKYKDIAYVTIPDVNYGWTYEVRNPCIITEQRALKVGESVLCALNSGHKDGVISETLLDFSRSDWDEQLKRLETVLEDRSRRVYASTGSR